ncbi:MAG: Fur family transcriptional regulator [Gammaproteobacteria bacterium]|nr:Fur family transcriptional regulator [Gammaproteobacteria bacterium]
MNSKKGIQRFPTPRHNHATCVNTAMHQAEDYCNRTGVRLTQLRRRVLELVWSSHRPVGAYDLLEQLEPKGRKAAPPTVYRSLDFLLEHKLIHRIDSLNAFIGCNQPGHEHDAQFFICKACGEAAELIDPKVERALVKDANQLGFNIEKQTVEIAGLCNRCHQGRKK